MDEELDIVVFEDDAGNEIKMEVIDYLAYEGKEYAMLTPVIEDDEEVDEDDEAELYIMEVVPAEDDMEEFVPVEDEKLAEQLIALFESDDFDDEFDEDEDGEE